MAKPLPDCEKVKAIAKQAGAAILEELGKLETLEIKAKGDESPVTNADTRAHTLVCEGLKVLTPNIPIMSEEDTTNHAALIGAKEYWCVDPLDGTKTAIAYARGEKDRTGFGVHIALIREGVPVLGVVYFPATRTIYYTSNDRKACRQIGEEAPTVLRKPPLGKSMNVAVGHVSAHSAAAPEQVAGKAYNSVPLVGGGRIIAAAEGKVDIAYMADRPAYSFWDVAAAHAVLLLMGGEFMSSGQENETYSTADSLKKCMPVRYNRGLYGKAIPAIAPALAAHADTFRFLGVNPAQLPVTGREGI